MFSEHFYNRLKVLENKQVFTVNINHLLEKIAVDVPILQATFGKDKSIVIKPKSTNFGLGISIFQEPTNLDSSQKALEIAFSEDSSVLGEEFIAGTEYRFFVLDGKCEAVLLRLPANVRGDDRHTIRELVATKNTNPLRGRDHRSPLERIKLGEIELLMLEQQGYKADDILPKGVQVSGAILIFLLAETQ